MKSDCFMTLYGMSRVVRGIAILLLAVPVAANAQADCGSGTPRQAKRESLRQSGISVLNAIEQKNSEGLLNYVGIGGIGFGVDKVSSSREDLRTQFAHKNGAYCLFFSTACIPEMSHFKGLEPDEALAKWKISYSEWLSLNKEYSIDVELEDDDGIGECRGYFSAGARREMKNAPNNIELDFYFEKGRWWLVGTVAGVP